MKYIIDNFLALSNEDVIRMSVTHVLGNGRPSIEEEAPDYADAPTCTYAGIGCAAAPFLKPEMRGSPELRNKTWAYIAREDNCDRYEALVGVLQQCHDGAAVYPKGTFIDSYKHNVRTDLHAVFGSKYHELIEELLA